MAKRGDSVNRASSFLILFMYMYPLCSPLMRPQMPLDLHPCKVILSERLIQYNRHRIGQVQGSDIRIHRNPHTGFLMVIQDIFRYACTFLSKHDVTVRFVMNLRIFIRSFCCRIVNLCTRILRKEVFVILINFIIQMFPVIKSCSFTDFSSSLNPSGSIRWSFTPAAQQVLPIFPVFAGISGS